MHVRLSSCKVHKSATYHTRKGTFAQQEQEEELSRGIFMVVCVSMWQVQIFGFSGTLLTLVGRVNIRPCSQRRSVRGGEWG